MSNSEQRPSRDAVLDGFAVEADHGRATLERYLLLYPEYAGDLVDASRAFGRIVEPFDDALSDSELHLLQSAWHRHETAVLHPAVDPWKTLTVAELRRAAEALGLPRQVLTAFRERRVKRESVPERFLMRLAAAISTSADLLREWMEAVPAAELARSYKADEKPAEMTLVTFHRILMDAGVSSEQCDDLLSDAD